jgi:hypothetical protein
LERKTPTAVAAGVVPGNDEKELLLGATLSSAEEDPPAYSGEHLPEPSRHDGTGSGQVQGESDEDTEDPDDEGDVREDDEDDEIELDLRFMPGDFKSTNV